MGDLWSARFFFSSNLVGRIFFYSSARIFFYYICAACNFFQNHPPPPSRVKWSAPYCYYNVIHKGDVPLRPSCIVSCVNTFAYDLSAYLANTLSPLTGNLEFTVTNSAHFVSTISSETVLDNKTMVSFDIELFTNVPIDTTVQAALQKLENTNTCSDR